MPQEPPRFGAIDIGTNSVLLLVVEQEGGRLVPVAEKAVITRIGRGVDRTQRLNPEAVRDTLQCLDNYAKELASLNVGSLCVVGTSALRDARGSENFLAQAEHTLGSRVRIISGEEEAKLSFRGAVSGLNIVGPATVFDIGGGSTEVVAGSTQSGAAIVRCAQSVDIGAVRLHERHVRGDPVAPTDLAAIRQDARSRLPPDSSLYRNALVVGVAGTVTTLVAVAKELEPYDGALVHGARLLRGEVEHWLLELARMNLEERRRLKGLDPRRADVIVAGAAIMLELMDWLEVDSIVVSDRGLRWGLLENAASLARG